ncbi:MAG: hypothetical protein M3N49_06785, partial [Candidatus Eremiobacteraeota bacterium]|nr:hypothetical protein [Candidatus Eremiobacteraeota bacterium]
FLRDRISYAKSDSAAWGPFSVSYSLGVHLIDGTVTLNDDGTIEVTGLKAVWDPLSVNLSVTLPQWCVGGDCIVPTPWGCAVRLPEICVGGNVVSISPDLSGAESKVTDFKADLQTIYFTDPARPPGLTDVAAELGGTPNKWQIFLHPDRVLIEPIDPIGTFGNLLIAAVNKAIDDLLGPLPDWVKGLVHDLIGPVEDLIKSILGIADDLDTWFQNLLGSLNLVADLETAIAQYFAQQYPLHEFPDPFPMLPGDAVASLPVFIPLRNLAATVNSAEMVATVDVGAI